MTKRMGVLLFAPLALSGCAVTKLIIENEDVIAGASETAEGFGSYGAIVGLLGTTVVAGAKWYEHKATTKETVKSVQKGIDSLDPKAKAMFKEQVHKHMPSKVKKIVAKVKKKL